MGYGVSPIFGSAWPRRRIAWPGVRRVGPEALVSPARYWGRRIGRRPERHRPACRRPRWVLPGQIRVFEMVKRDQPCDPCQSLLQRKAHSTPCLVRSLTDAASRLRLRPRPRCRRSLLWVLPAAGTQSAVFQSGQSRPANRCCERMSPTDIDLPPVVTSARQQTLGTAPGGS